MNTGFNTLLTKSDERDNADIINAIECIMEYTVLYSKNKKLPLIKLDDEDKNAIFYLIGLIEPAKLAYSYNRQKVKRLGKPFSKSGDSTTYYREIETFDGKIHSDASNVSSMTIENLVGNLLSCDFVKETFGTDLSEITKKLFEKCDFTKKEGQNIAERANNKIVWKTIFEIYAK